VSELRTVLLSGPGLSKGPRRAPAGVSRARNPLPPWMLGGQPARWRQPTGPVSLIWPVSCGCHTQSRADDRSDRSIKTLMGRGGMMITDATGRAGTLSRVRLGLIIGSWTFVLLGFALMYGA